MAGVSDWTFDGTWPFEPRWYELDDAGHYLQEDAHELIVPELVRFVSAL